MYDNYIVHSLLFNFQPHNNPSTFSPIEFVIIVSHLLLHTQVRAVHEYAAF